MNGRNEREIAVLGNAAAGRGGKRVAGQSAREALANRRAWRRVSLKERREMFYRNALAIMYPTVPEECELLPQRPLLGGPYDGAVRYGR